MAGRFWSAASDRERVRSARAGAEALERSLSPWPSASLRSEGGKLQELVSPRRVVGSGVVASGPMVATLLCLLGGTAGGPEDRLAQNLNRGVGVDQFVQVAGMTSGVPPTAVATTTRPTHCASISDTGAPSESGQVHEDVMVAGLQFTVDTFQWNVALEVYP